MDIFGLDIFKYLWQAIGIGVMLAGISYLAGSAKSSLERTKTGSIGAKVWSVADELLIGILMVGALYFIFFNLSFGDIIQFAAKIVAWLWNTLIVPLLKLFGVPV